MMPVSVEKLGMKAPKAELREDVMSSRGAICIAEDRPDEEDGIRELIMSIHEHVPEAKVPAIIAFLPNATPDLLLWLGRYPTVHVQSERLPGSRGWNVKPHALIWALDAGYDPVAWIDSDVIFSANAMNLLQPDSNETLVVAQEPSVCEYSSGGPERTIAWGFPVGRPLNFSANTGVVVCTNAHRALLERWRLLIESDFYRRWQQQTDREMHVMGDQDVLTALLGSKRFADVPVRRLRSGIDVVQCYSPGGFTPYHRVRSVVMGMPPLIHAQFLKPWRQKRTLAAGSARGSLALELSPYVIARRRARRSEPMPPWAVSHSLSGVILMFLGAGHPALAGIWPGTIDYLRRRQGQLRGRGRIKPATAHPPPDLSSAAITE